MTLSLHVPEPEVRPGDTPDFSNVVIPKAGEIRRPEIDETPEAMRDLAFGIIRVLNRQGEAVGPWKPDLSEDQLRDGLRHMLMLRAYDARMMMAQRQGKTSFYMQNLGEEAVAGAPAAGPALDAAALVVGEEVLVLDRGAMHRGLQAGEMLARTTLTSLTTLLALLALYSFGGEVIRSFTAAMIFGIVIGTYSSIFVAAPLLILFRLRPGRAAGDDDREKNDVSGEQAAT